MKPGTILKCVKSFRVCLGYGPNNDGLCAVGELFMLGLDSCDDELELWAIGELVAPQVTWYKMPTRTYHEPTLIPEYAEVVYEVEE